MKLASMVTLFSVLVNLTLTVSSPVHAQTWERPFTTNSIWYTPIAPTAVYVPCNLGALGAMANDRMWLFRTYSNDPLRPVFQPEGFEKPGVRIPDSLFIPNEPNGCASFLLTDGVTLREYNALRRTTNGSNPIGYWYGDHLLTGDGIRGGQAGSGMSTLGGTIRIGELESSNPITHALKLELDWAVLYKNSSNRANQSQTYRWPANRSDNNFGGTGDGPAYRGTNPALRMGSLVALPKSLNINSLGLSAKGLKIAKAMQDYGAYIVDSTGVYWWYNNTGYTASISVEANASTDYFRSNNGYYNNTQLYSDMDKIYRRLFVIDNNGPDNIGGTNETDIVPIGRVISLRATNGFLVSNDLADGANLKAALTSGSPGSRERFRVVDAGNGKVALYSLNNSRYVSVYNDITSKPLRASFATGIQSWEKFDWVTRSGVGKVALRSGITGKFVSANLDNGGRLTAALATTVGSWEDFTWVAE